MLKTNQLTIFFAALLILISCSTNSFESKEALLEYITNPKNGYFFQKNVNGVDFSLLYRPTDLLVLQELGDKKGEPKIIDSLRSHYNKYLYFILSMSKNDQELLNSVAGDRQKFGAMVNELAFGMENKVHFYTEKKDTIPLTDFIYPRMYGMSRSTDILFVYSKSNIPESKELNFTIEDLGFYTGETQFKIPYKKIEHQPQIDFK